MRKRCIRFKQLKTGDFKIFFGRLLCKSVNVNFGILEVIFHEKIHKCENYELN